MSPKSMKGVMDEFQQGKLHSGSKTGPKVTSRKQAIAIGLSEQRQARGKATLKGGKKAVGKKGGSKGGRGR